MKLIHFLMISLAIMLSGCQGSGLKIINHPEPDLKADFAAYHAIGGCQADGLHWYDCNNSERFLSLGCNYLSESSALAALTPSHSMGWCIAFKSNDLVNYDFLPSECISIDIRQSGNYCFRIIIQTPDGFQIIKNVDQFRQTFAPVNTANESIAFAVVLSKYVPLYGQTKQDGYEYYASTLEDTYVRYTLAGYIVHLFDVPGVGCGPFYTNSVDMLVTTTGQVQELNHKRAYRNPADDTLCAD